MSGRHAHAPAHASHANGHTHGLVDHSVRRSRAGFRAVALSLGILGLTALVQAAVFALSSSVALLADLIHNVGDALTAVPIGIAFLLRNSDSPGSPSSSRFSSPPASPSTRPSVA